jgi:hypothetical protein
LCCSLSTTSAYTLSIIFELRFQALPNETDQIFSLTAGGEPPIHELQHLHWDGLLVKILAFEPTANCKCFSNSIDALIFEFDDNGILAARLVPNNISDFKIGVH